MLPARSTKPNRRQSKALLGPAISAEAGFRWSLCPCPGANVARNPFVFSIWNGKREIVRIWDLSPGIAIRIVKTFRDHRGNEFTKGTVLHFKHRNYLPYHSGHTVYFEEATMSLCDDDDTRDVVENSNNEYFETYQL